MALSQFQFTPSIGLRDSTAYPTNPGSEAAAREQVQRGMDQLRDWLNGQFQTDLSNTYPKKAQDAWTVPTLQTGWTTYGSGYADAGYYKDEFGIVRLKGNLKSGTVGFTGPVFTLPVGYRPFNKLYSPIVSNSAFGMVEIQDAGNIYVVVGSSAHISLDSIAFRAER